MNSLGKDSPIDFVWGIQRQKDSSFHLCREGFVKFLIFSMGFYTIFYLKNLEYSFHLFNILRFVQFNDFLMIFKLLYLFYNPLINLPTVQFFLRPILFF